MPNTPPTLVWLGQWRPSPKKLHSYAQTSIALTKPNAPKYSSSININLAESKRCDVVAHLPLKSTSDFLCVVITIAGVDGGSCVGAAGAIGLVLFLWNWVLDGIEFNFAQSSFAKINTTNVREPDQIQQNIRELFTQVLLFLFFPTRKALWNFSFPLKYLWKLSHFTHLRFHQKSKPFTSTVQNPSSKITPFWLLWNSSYFAYPCDTKAKVKAPREQEITKESFVLEDFSMTRTERKICLHWSQLTPPGEKVKNFNYLSFKEVKWN